jgi:hypothetical protein
MISPIYFGPARPRNTPHICTHHLDNVYFFLPQVYLIPLSLCVCTHLYSPLFFFFFFISLLFFPSFFHFCRVPFLLKEKLLRMHAHHTLVYFFFFLRPLVFVTQTDLLKWLHSLVFTNTHAPSLSMSLYVCVCVFVCERKKNAKATSRRIALLSPRDFFIRSCLYLNRP